MNNKGVTYFRLNSPYEGDITKNCALDGYEVDNNFFTLEGRDIKSVYVEENEIKIELINGEVIKSGDVFSKFAQDLSVDFDAEHGILYVKQNGQVKKIEGFVTEYSSNWGVATDSTLKGNGKPSKPLSISPMYKPGVYVPVKKFIDLTADDCNPCGCPNCTRIADKLPNPCGLIPGDRFLVRTENSDYGMLYNYEGIKKIACDLIGSNSEWRIPTKDDWDDMLNAIEPCDSDRTHSSASSNMWLGRFAGKFLKSKHLWRSEGCCNDENTETCIDYNGSNCVNMCNCGHNVECDPMHCGEYNTCQHKHRKCDHRGIDKYGFGVTPAGYADDGMLYGYFGERAMFWTATVSRSGASSYAKRFDYNKSAVYQDIVPTTLHLSLRLVKDYDGNNYLEREDILTDNYPTVLMPSVKTGRKVWTSVNIALNNRCYGAILPNDGQGVTLIKKYFIYEWDGKEWLTNEVKEGEVVAVLDAPNGRYSSAYKVINGELVDLDLRTVNNVLNLIQPKFDNLETLITTEKERAMAAEERLEAAIDSTTARLDNEILERRQADEELDGKITAEKEAREAKDAELEQAIADEVAARTAADEALTAALEAEALARAEKDAEIEANLNAEIEAREAKDAELEQAIADEVAARTAADEEEKAAREAKDAELEERINEFSGSIEQEKEERIAADEELDAKITAEKEAREAKDAELEQAIADETAAREAKDEEIEGKLLTEEGTEFDSENGVLTLKSAAGTNDITVQFSFNFGEI
jgi:hypothetical protein